MSKVSRALDVLYMQGEDAGKSNYGSAVHQMTAVKEAEQAINTYIEEVLETIIGKNELPTTVRMIGVPEYTRDRLREKMRDRASKLGFKIKD